MKLFRREMPTVEALSCPRSVRAAQRVRLRLADFVDVSDGYAIRTLTSIQQLASGERPEPFTIRAGD